MFEKNLGHDNETLKESRININYAKYYLRVYYLLILKEI